MGQMHELLGVEGAIAQQHENIVDETIKVFRDKTSLFIGSHRKHESFNEDDKVVIPEEHKALASTVQTRLDYTTPFIERYFDIIFQKEKTNQTASADIVIDGKVIASNVPATYLLTLETKLLKQIRRIYEAIPTLDVGTNWIPAPEHGSGVFRMDPPEEKLRTEKKFKYQVLYDATDKHPAQIEKWEEQVPTGKFIKNVWCGMYTSAQKSDILRRLDTLLEAVKRARQVANTQTVCTDNIAAKLMEVINGK